MYDITTLAGLNPEILSATSKTFHRHIVMSTPSSKSEDTSNTNDSSDTEYDRKPVQLFGRTCENWDDVYGIIQEYQPTLIEKFLYLFRMHV